MRTVHPTSPEELPDPWEEAQTTVKQSVNREVQLQDPWEPTSNEPKINYGGYVYVIQDIESRLYKIGRTANMHRRMQELGVGKTARLVTSKYVANAPAVERKAHERYKNSRLPQTEYFRLNTPPAI